MTDETRSTASALPATAAADDAANDERAADAPERRGFFTRAGASVAKGLQRPLVLLEDNLRKPTGWSGRLVGHAMALQHHTLTSWALEQMQVRPPDWVLDVGCGGGMAVKRLAKLAGEGCVAGVDYSPEMVRQATRRNARAVREGHVQIVHGDVAALPFPDARFDKVSGIETFYFWPDPIAGLREIHRVLKPGGQVTIVLEMSKEGAARPKGLTRTLAQWFTSRSAADGLAIVSGPELVGRLAEAGFENLRYESQPARSLGWLCATGFKPCRPGADDEKAAAARCPFSSQAATSGPQSSSTCPMH